MLINIQLVVLPLLAWAVEGVRPMRSLLWIVPMMLLGWRLPRAPSGTRRSTGAGSQPVWQLSVCYAAYLAIIRRTAPRTVRPAPFTVLAVVCLSAGLVSLAAAAGTGRLVMPAGWEGWAWFAALALVGQVITYLSFNIAMTGITEVTSSTLMLLSAVFAVVLDVIIFGRIPTVWQLLGCGLIIAYAWCASVLSANRRVRQEAAVRTPRSPRMRG
ncbi:DMT family transporter [Nesterenkonia pannonica]|uniref:DMT family transporter n=1 Tax=Nesterenkonia pannonica TaxID=1548602 RepID=UPI0021649DFB|nr:DMT family transporter [Nesterenkonia pannonica]